MSNIRKFTSPGPSRARLAAFVFAVSLIVAGIAAEVIFGATAGLLACAIVAVPLLLALLTDRGDGDVSRDPETGLPDRNDALRRLGEIVRHGHSRSKQGAFLVAAVDTPDGVVKNQAALSRAETLLLAALRLASVLRKGDRVVRIADDELGVILNPARGIEVRSVRHILERIDEAFGRPFLIDGTKHHIEVALGGCLQRDAPLPDESSWLEAAEHAATIARECGPHLYWIADVASGPRWERAPDGEPVSDDVAAAHGRSM